MATQGCAAVGTRERWKGVLGLGGEPSRLGKQVFEAARQRSDGLAVMCQEILAAGRWEYFTGDLSRKAAYVATPITSDDPDPLWIEWFYVLDPETSSLHVLRSVLVKSSYERREGEHPWQRDDGAWEYGHTAAKLVEIATLYMDRPPPEWTILDAARAPVINRVITTRGE